MVSKFHGRYYILIFLLGILLVSCDDVFVFFKNPQPYSFKDIPKFPENLQGHYVGLGNDLTDSMVVIIERKRIVETRYYSQKFSVSDSMNTEIINVLKEGIDTKKKTDKADKTFYTEKNDTFYYYHVLTSIYDLGKELSLRYMDGIYFLNLKLEPKKEEKSPVWCVCLMTLSENGKLAFKLPKLNDRPYPADSIRGKQDKMPDTVALKYYSSITPFEISTDSSVYIANPDSTQLRKLIKGNLFGEYETFQKQK